MTDAPQRPWWRTPWWRGTRERKVLLIAEIIVIGLIGAWLGLLAGGNLDAGVGPLRTRLSVAPSIGGGSTVEIPPLGELRVKTHQGPWKLTAEVTRIDAADARRIFSNPAAVNGHRREGREGPARRGDHGGAEGRRWRRCSAGCCWGCWCSAGGGGWCC